MATPSAKNRRLQSIRKLERLFGTTPPPGLVKLSVRWQPLPPNEVGQSCSPLPSPPTRPSRTPRRPSTAPASTSLQPFPSNSLHNGRTHPRDLYVHSSRLKDRPNPHFGAPNTTFETYVQESPVTRSPRPLPPVPISARSSSSSIRSPRPLPPTPQSSVQSRLTESVPERFVDMESSANAIVYIPHATTLTPTDIRRKKVARMTKLTRFFGTTPPSELVFKTDAPFKCNVEVGESDDEREAWNHTMHPRKDSVESDVWIRVSSTSLRRTVSFNTSTLSNRISPASRRGMGVGWTKEIGSNRWVVNDYENVAQMLREL